MNEPKHPLATVRRLIGLNQKEMAKLIGCSLPTVQAIEYCKLKLSDKLATIISQKTGVDALWLRIPLGPLKDHEGKPYTRETYEHHQALLFAPAQDSSRVESRLVLARSCFLRAVGRLAILFTKALRENKVIMCHYKVGSATEELLAELGTFKTLSDEERGRWFYLWCSDLKPEDRGGYGGLLMAQGLLDRIVSKVGGQELMDEIGRFIEETEAVFQRQLEQLKLTPQARQHSASVHKAPQRPSSQVMPSGKIGQDSQTVRIRETHRLTAKKSRHVAPGRASPRRPVS